MRTRSPRIGVLALQGAFREHVRALQALGAEAVEVRLPRGLDGLDGLVLPGGETTTQRKLAKLHGLWEPIRELGREGLPILATCAGVILLAAKVDDGHEDGLGLLDVDVRRNAYGRQVFSFEAPLDLPCLASQPAERPAPFPAVFIRAPRIVRAGKAVSVLGRWKGDPVAVQQGDIVGLCFHPEITADRRLHRHFLDRLPASRPARASSAGR